MAWTSAASVSYVAWAEPSPLSASTDNGIDFQLQFRDTYPMIMSNDRPLVMQDSLGEGQP